MTRKRLAILIGCLLTVVVIISAIAFSCMNSKHRPSFQTLSGMQLENMPTRGLLDGGWAVIGNLNYTQLELVLDGAYPHMVQLELAPSFVEEGERRWRFGAQVLVPQQFWACDPKKMSLVFSDGRAYPLHFPFHGQQRCQSVNGTDKILGITLLSADKRQTRLDIGEEILSGHYPYALVNEGEKLVLSNQDWEKTLRSLKTILRYNRSLLLRNTLNANHSPYEGVPVRKYPSSD